MKKLLIGDIIYKLRKEKEITQEQLANFIGVSTAAVSKWEGGISYPDITLLPVIATFFNVSIDTLLDFKTELTDDEVMDIYVECEKLFSSGELEEAVKLSRDYVEKYPYSYFLKLRIGFLFTMYSWKASEEDQGMKMIGYSIDLYEDVAKNCSKSELTEQALFQLGALYPTVGDAHKAIDALNKIPKRYIDPDVILANIYIEKSEYKKAREILQSKLYKNINDISLFCMGLANSYIRDERDLNMAENYYKLSIDIKKSTSLNGNSGLSLYTEYLNFAQVYLKFKERNKAMDMLMKMVEDIRNHDINNPEKFSSIWCFKDILQVKRTITMNLYENIFKILEASEFDLIREEKEFKDIINELKDLDRKSNISR